jgi:hypothetical protein
VRFFGVSVATIDAQLLSRRFDRAASFEPTPRE